MPSLADLMRADAGMHGGAAPMSLADQMRADAAAPVQQSASVQVQQQPAPQDSLWGDIRNAAGGFARAGMGIVSNVMRPLDALTGANDPTMSSLITGKPAMTAHEQRMARIDARFKNQGYDTNSLSFQGGKLGGEVAATAPIGGALASGAKYIPGLTKALPGIESAIETGGLRLGTPAAKTAADVVRNVATRVGAGGLVGGASAGIVDPENAGTGALIGGALPVAVKTAGVVGNAVKSAVIDPLVNHDAIIGKTLARAVGADNVGSVVGTLGNAPKTPGVQFSAAQRTGNGVLASFEDAIKATNPGGDLSLQATNNNYALASALRRFAGDDASIEAAKQARQQAATPLYTAARNSDVLADPTRTVNLIDRIVSKNPANSALTGPLQQIRDSLFESYPLTQRGSDAWKVLDGALGGRMSSSDADAIRGVRTVMDRVRKGTISADDALSQMSEFSAKSKTAQDAIDLAKQHINTPDNVLMQKPNQIMSAIDNIKAMMGNKDNAFVVGQLDTIKNSLAHQLSKAAPEFKQAEQTFSTMSRPINQMQVGQLLANKLIPSTAGDIPSRLNASSLATALRNPNQVAKMATGFKRARLDKVLDPEQLNLVNGVNADASRIAEMNALGNGSGSATARRQSINGFIGENLANEFPITSKVIGALGNVPGINIPLHGVGAAANMVGGKINQAIAAKLENVLANDPAKLAQLLRKGSAAQQDQLGQLLGVTANPVLRSMIYNAPAITSATP